MYIYIYRERERDRDIPRNVCSSKFDCTGLDPDQEKKRLPCSCSLCTVLRTVLRMFC